MSVQNGLKISFDGEEELIDENAFEGGYIVCVGTEVFQSLESCLKVLSAQNC